MLTTYRSENGRKLKAEATWSNEPITWGWNTGTQAQQAWIASAELSSGGPCDVPVDR